MTVDECYIFYLFERNVFINKKAYKEQIEWFLYFLKLNYNGLHSFENSVTFTTIPNINPLWSAEADIRVSIDCAWGQHFQNESLPENKNGNPKLYV